MPDDGLRECRDRAARLQGQLARVSRTLGQTCDETARQHEILAHRRSAATASDHEASAQLWRALADQARAAARAWETDAAISSPSATAWFVPADASMLDGASRPVDGVAALPEWGKHRSAFDGLQTVGDAELFQVPSGLGDTVVRRLFRIGLRLNELLPRTTGAVRHRVTEIIGDVEACLGEIRKVAFAPVDDTSEGPD